MNSFKEDRSRRKGFRDGVPSAEVSVIHVLQSIWSNKLVLIWILTSLGCGVLFGSIRCLVRNICKIEDLVLSQINVFKSEKI